MIMAMLIHGLKSLETKKQLDSLCAENRQIDAEKPFNLSILKNRKPTYVQEEV